MNDAPPVRRIQGNGDFRPVSQSGVDRKGSSRHACSTRRTTFAVLLGPSELGRAPRASRAAKRLSFEKLHDEKIDAVLMAHVVERADVRMIERGDRSGFAIEPLTKRGVEPGRWGDDLDRDSAVQPRIPSTVDLTHAAGADPGIWQLVPS